MQRPRRTPVAGRGILVLVTSALLALGFLLVPAGSAASPASAAAAPAARTHRPTNAAVLAAGSTSAIPTSTPVHAARTGAKAGQGERLTQAGPGPSHLAATPPTSVGLDVRAPRASPAQPCAAAVIPRPARTTSSRAPPTGPLTPPPPRPAVL